MKVGSIVETPEGRGEVCFVNESSVLVHLEKPVTRPGWLHSQAGRDWWFVRRDVVEYTP